MKTEEALTGFLKECEERGLSPTTRERYHGYLRHFVEEYPELPTDTPSIEKFLKKRKEPPTKRGDWFKRIQAFYSYLERAEGIKSPVPPKGRIGRPPKAKLVTTVGSTHDGEQTKLGEEKLVTGGSVRIELHIYLHR